MQQPLPFRQHRFDNIRFPSLTDAEKTWIVKTAMTILQSQHVPGQALTSANASQEYLQFQLANEKQEVFGCIFLDNRNRIIKDEILFRGTIDRAAVYPRVVVQRALKYNAARLLLYHNHPSGVADPSEADQRITKEIRKALDLVEIEILDHLIVCPAEVTSFAKASLL